jgi:hypothetical protein
MSSFAESANGARRVAPNPAFENLREYPVGRIKGDVSPQICRNPAGGFQHPAHLGQGGDTVREELDPGLTRNRVKM